MARTIGPNPIASRTLMYTSSSASAARYATHTTAMTSAATMIVHAMRLLVAAIHHRAQQIAGRNHGCRQLIICSALLLTARRVWEGFAHARRLVCRTELHLLC